MQQQKTKMSQKKFRIGELAKELKVKKFVVRFWEKEFEFESDRSRGGQRFYNDDDLTIFLTIKDLLYNQGYTIAGAKAQLSKVVKHKSTVETVVEAHDPSTILPSSVMPVSHADISAQIATQSTQIPANVLAQIHEIRVKLEKIRKLLN